jgi:16S rRNA (adenine1518-N6/adenine1519-N6)-dimethyltransferase
VKVRDARALLREHGLHPKKSFGQNFLVAEGVLEKIAAECVPEAEIGRARVVELGAGLGALTARLAQRAEHLVAVERDRDLVPVLRQLFADVPNVEVVEGDAQTIDLRAYLGASGAPRVLCGTLPYQITGSLLERAVHGADALDRVVFMVQREVADRLVAEPSTKAYGALSVFVQAAFGVRRALGVTRGAFHPPPEVASAVVVLTPHAPRRAEETPQFRDLVKHAFSARRKTLRNAWSRLADESTMLEVARTCGISLDARGETLSVDDFARAANALAARNAGGSAALHEPVHEPRRTRVRR